MVACRLASSFASAQLVPVNWASSSVNGDGESLQLLYAPLHRSAGGSASRAQVRMGNKNEGRGVFAPVVVLARNVLGKKQFNQLRGKGIALHSQVIGEFCKSIGADAKQKQGLIRLAKKNGEKLGFLA